VQENDRFLVNNEKKGVKKFTENGAKKKSRPIVNVMNYAVPSDAQSHTHRHTDTHHSMHVREFGKDPELAPESGAAAPIRMLRINAKVINPRSVEVE
jgi:hypothetical protein